MTNTSPSAPKPEFSFEADLTSLSRSGKTFHLKASAEDLSRIATRLKVISAEKLEGDLTLTPASREFTVKGVLRASLTRECVASLEPMEEAIEEQFEVTFLRQPDEASANGLTDSEEWDGEEAPPDVHSGDIFDLGEFMVQQLSLAMDPFPRKPGARSLAESYARPENISPFAGLQGALKKSDENQ